MAENTSEMTSKKHYRKAGKTLLVKPSSTNFDDTVLQQLEGLTQCTKTERSGSYFLTFDTVLNSSNALKKLNFEHSDSLRVKYAHYRVFFKIDGIDDDSDYNQVKELHINSIQQNTDAEVLYYKLYRRDEHYLGCGDITIDTKKALDSLLNNEEGGMKHYTLDNGMSGVYHRYNRKPRNNMSSSLH